MPGLAEQKPLYLVCFAVISITVVGYYVGLQAPMNPADRVANLQPNKQLNPGGDILAATHYRDIGEFVGRPKSPLTKLSELKQLNYDPTAEFTITPEEKSFALAIREDNRAFNGAPPTVPHPIEQMSSETCAVCHQNGAKTATLRISKMSHGFLANCTQCHVEQNPVHMTASQFRENSFVGLAAPTGGPTAYTGAPPQIPHSTWMRIDCLSCHGFTGNQGIRTTHPWRQNCQQCHSPSAELEQVQLDFKPQFLSPPKINR